MQRRFDDLKFDAGSVTRDCLQQYPDFITAGDACLGISGQCGPDTKMVLFFERCDFSRCRGADQGDYEQKD
jgi:hypothetical protein